MFTGIIENIGTIKEIRQEGGNVDFIVASNISRDLQVDQSLSHNGVCLTVVEKTNTWHRVTAIAETLKKTSLGTWKVGDAINLERAMRADARLDGHMVQGHVDTTTTCEQIKEAEGSWYFTFRFQEDHGQLLVDKGSICINGVSLTLVAPQENTFQVAIIPYTFEHTNFHRLSVRDVVNIEFDIIGKYIAKHLSAYKKTLGV